MESISQLVSDTLARHGIRPRLDHSRLHWSRWFRCESSFSVLLAPSKPGIFALAEEIIAAEQPSSSVGRRMLALFHIAETDDLGMALGRLFLPGNPLRERLASGTCFARYALVEEVSDRKSAFDALQRWIQDASETASGLSNKPVPSASLAWGAKLMEVPNREQTWEISRPEPLPSGF